MTSMKRISVLLFVLLGLGLTQLSCARKVEQPNEYALPSPCDPSTDKCYSSASPPPNDLLNDSTGLRDNGFIEYAHPPLPITADGMTNMSATEIRSPKNTDSNSSGGLLDAMRLAKIEFAHLREDREPEDRDSRSSGGLMNEVAPAFTHGIQTLAQSGTDRDSSSSGGLMNEVRKTQPLPHDGLFIRRNNEFGTKLDVGIKDLIDQGVSIEQTHIRFDDFVALNSDRVPLPQSGQSLAVSYGVAPIPLSQKRDDRATHYLEIALRASDVAPAGHSKTQAPPVNYIFVIDTSSSMSGEKLDTVKTAIRELFKRMRKDDVLGIVEFNDQPRTLLRATPVGKISRNEFSRIISNLTASGGTDLNIGLSFGIDEIGRYESDASLNQIFLFSDGQPTSGERDWIKIRQNVDKKTRGDIRLSTFAFGADANTRELDALAGLTGGKSSFIADPTDTEEIHLSLQEELNRREHLAGINVQLKVEIDRDIPIYHLYGHDRITDPRRRAAVLQDLENVKKEAEAELGVTPAADLVTEEKGIRIFVPDLAVGETYWVVFELAIPEGKRQSPVGKTTVQYVDTFARKNRKSEFQLSASGKLPADLVVEHALGLWTSEVAFYALEDLYQKDLDTAKKRIEKHVALLSAANDNLSSEQIADDTIVLKKFVSLAENLGKVKAASDVSTQSYNILLIHGLPELGRVRNGYLRTNYSPNP